MNMNSLSKVDRKPLQKPEVFKNPMCTICGRDEELRLGFCFECANLQAMLIDGNTMLDNEDVSDWNKSELLAFIVRTAMGYQGTKEFNRGLKRMQIVVQGYFKNILDLPCPDFTENAKRIEQKYE